MPRHVVPSRELEWRRDEGDTVSRAVAIDSEVLELRVVRYDQGRSKPQRLAGGQEVLYVVSGSGTLFVDGHAHELGPRTGAYVAAGEHYEIESEGLQIVSVLAPQEQGGARTDRRIVRYDDQPSLPASGDREFRYLVTNEAVTQFYGVIAPGRAPEHSHVYDEVIYVLEGEGALHTEGADEPVTTGSCIHLPPFLVHSLENSGDSPMQIVAVFHPAGDPASRAYEAG